MSDRKVCTNLLGLVMAVSCGPGVAAQEIPAKPVEGKVPWLYRYEEGRQQARKTGKPLFVVFRCER